MIYTSSKECEVQENGKYRTEDFIYLAKYMIIQEIHNIHNEHKNKFGDIILCLDNSENGYWRKDFHPGYKSKRKSSRDESPYDWSEIFVYINELTELIKEHLPWKIVSVPRAEADDIMLALSRTYNKYEKILIYSPDKDMIQAQKNTNNVFQYSALTKKWLVPEHKNDDMEDWLMEHVCLGDSGDDVPRIIDETVFSENFLKYLKENNIKAETPMEFEKLDKKIQEELLSKYDVYKTNKKGEPTELDIYVKERLGLSTLKKKIKEIGSLDQFLDSHPLYRKHYNRNYILVMEDGIPSDIWNNIILCYKESKSNLNISEFEKYLEKHNLSSLRLTIAFESNKALTAEDFGW